MPSIMLSKLLSNTPIPPEAEREISGLNLDSRQIKAGDLFFALQGTQLNGKQFIEDAIKKGASAVLVESDSEELNYYNQVPIIPILHLKSKVTQLARRFYEDPVKQLKIIGVTGTNGKTSCTHFIASALAFQGIKCGVIGTLGSGFYGAIHPGTLTTPDAITLQALFADFVRKNAAYIAMEVSSHSIDQGRIKDLPFEIGIFTNLTRDHLDYHITMEAYGAVKRKLFDTSLTQYAVINADDLFGQELLSSLKRNHLISYSTKQPHATVYAEHIRLVDQGITTNIRTPWGQHELFIPLMGQFNLQNALAVLTALGLLGIPLEQAMQSLAQLTSVPGRMQTFGGHSKPLVVVDYAHSPDSLEKVLEALRGHCRGKLYCLFGCGGDRDRGKRPIMAAIAERLADFVMITDDNPRNEDPKVIVAEMRQGFKNPQKIKIEHHRERAIREIIQSANPNDCVLIAGKGAELYQQIGEEKIPFSDIQVVQQTLEPPPNLENP